MTERVKLVQALAEADKKMARAYQNRDLQAFYSFRDQANKLRRRLRDMDREETENGNS